MSEQYAREILRRNVAQICQTIGWNGINSTPLDILAHVLEKYIQTLGTQVNRYSEQFNRTEPNLNDLGLVFRDLNIQLPELSEFSRCVPSVPTPFHIDTFPKPKESNLNFLKPGSHEVVTRPMHVHEHLPPMYPEKERDTPVVAGTVEIRQNGIDNSDSANSICTSPEISVTDSPEKPKDLFKRPIDPVSLPNSKRPRLRLDEEERTREISSVMMTMSGFLSPAREGKLPEARPPTIISEKHIEKHKVNLNQPNPTKLPVIEKNDKKSKRSKLLNGKIVKNKRKDKSHKTDSSKSKDSSKLNKYPPGYVAKTKAHITSLKPTSTKMLSPLPKPVIPLPLPVVSPEVKPIVKQEPSESSTQGLKNKLGSEDAIPVPRRIPISKSPLVSNSVPVLPKQLSSTIVVTSETEIKKEIINEEEKLASQPDRSKINIFKRISNKSKEDRIAPEVVTQRSQSNPMISQSQISVNESVSEVKVNEIVRTKSGDTVGNNNDTSAVDLSKQMDLSAHEVINIDDDSMDIQPKADSQPSVSSKPLQVPYPKDITCDISPKIKKEKKHKDKKDKAARQQAKLLKKQQQQLARQMALAEKQQQSLSEGNWKSLKTNRPKNEPKARQISSNTQVYSVGRNIMPGPGLIPTNLVHGVDFLSGLTSNPALRGISSSNLISAPAAFSTNEPRVRTGTGWINLGTGMPNQSTQLGNVPQTSRTTSVKIPSMLRRPSLEVIPVEKDIERGVNQSPLTARENDIHDKHKAPTIPNILQKHKSKSHKEHKSNIFKMPPVQPDITIQLNPPKVDPLRQETPVVVKRSPTPEPTVQVQPPKQVSPPEPPKRDVYEAGTPEISQEKVVDNNSEKKKDKSHKKEKKDKEGIKIKKKKDKKDKLKDKSEKKKEKLKDKIKKVKKDKKKEKSGDGLVPKLTLKLSSSNSNSPMPPSSPDVFKLNIKPVVKKEEEESLSIKEKATSREQSRSPELAQISALVTRPPKQKHSKQNNILEPEAHSSSPPPVSSPSRKNRPPTGHSHTKYKRILFKPLSKKGNLEDDEEMASVSEDPTVPFTDSNEKLNEPLPYYVDEQGNKIWVCPACGKPDNGSPMIGCDGCDCWFHWQCIGITEEPAATEDWFCKSCLAKRPAMVLAGVSSAKKRGRKSKGEKTRDCH